MEKSLLWCAASNKGTEHHLELIFSCQIISAKGKETRENKPQPLQQQLQTPQSLPASQAPHLFFPWQCKPSASQG